MNINLEKRPCYYAIRHCATNKLYVGRTRSLKRRIENHINALKRGEHPVEQFQYDYDNYGKKIEIFILDSNKIQLEKLWFTLFRSNNKNFGYNYKEANRNITIDDFEKVATFEE